MESIRDLLIDELRDILSAEQQIVKALPAMVKAAQSPELKDAFNSHLKETKGQVARLNKIFRHLNVSNRPKFCKGAKGLIDEGKEVIEGHKASLVRDAALISKAQRIEHYEISAYGTMRTFAKELGLSEIVKLLDESLAEESNADKKLSKLAEGGFLTSGINHKAHREEEHKEEKKKTKKAAPKARAKTMMSKAKKAIAKAVTPAKAKKAAPKKGPAHKAKKAPAKAKRATAKR